MAEWSSLDGGSRTVKLYKGGRIAEILNQLPYVHILALAIANNSFQVFSTVNKFRVNNGLANLSSVHRVRLERTSLTYRLIKRKLPH